MIQIKIKSKTSTEYQDVFDYSSSKYTEQQFCITEEGSLIKRDEKLEFFPIKKNVNDRSFLLNSRKSIKEDRRLTDLIEEKKSFDVDNEIFTLIFKDGFQNLF